MVSPAPKDAPEWIASAVAGLAHQIGGPDAWGVPKCLLELKGSDLMGLPLSAPNATFERVYTLPLLTISMGKGTGVVTSVRGFRPPARNVRSGSYSARGAVGDCGGRARSSPSGSDATRRRGLAMCEIL